MHLVPPQKQVAVFDVTPFICVQSGAATHRQKVEKVEEHNAVEVDRVLYFRLCLILSQKHPGGSREPDTSLATT